MKFECMCINFSIVACFIRYRVVLSIELKVDISDDNCTVVIISSFVRCYRRILLNIKCQLAFWCHRATTDMHAC